MCDLRFEGYELDSRLRNGEDPFWPEDVRLFQL
jgi:hypothetical protein